MDLIELINEFDLAALMDSPVVGAVFAAFHSALIGVTVLAFVNCFFGYRIFRIFAALCGLGIGAAIGALLIALEPDNTGMMLMGVLSAIVLAAMTFVAFRFAAFLMGAFCGLAAGLVLVGWQTISMAPDLTDPKMLASFAAELLVPSVLIGLLCVLFYRPMIILSSGLMGMIGVYGLFELIGVELGPMIWALGLACSVLGIGVQFQFNPRGTLPGPGRWKPRAAASVGKPSTPKAAVQPKGKMAKHTAVEADATTRITADTMRVPAADLDQTTRITPEQMRTRMAQAQAAEPVAQPEIAPVIDMDAVMDQIQASVGETVREMQDSSPAAQPEDDLFGDIEQAIHNRIEAEQTQSPNRFCIKCGARNDADSKFCIHCGRELI